MKPTVENEGGAMTGQGRSQEDVSNPSKTPSLPDLQAQLADEEKKLEESMVMASQMEEPDDHIPALMT